MKLNVIKRNAGKKGETNRLRREGCIPSVIYHNGKAGESIAVRRDEYEAVLRAVKPGHLSTKKLILASKDGNHLQAIIKEIQYHPTTYDVLHLDFEQLDNNVPVTVNVPIEMLGVIDCVGAKLGGSLRQVNRTMRVRCLPNDIPESFTLDVKNLDVNQSLRLGDVKMSEALRPLSKLGEIAVTVTKK